MSNSLPPLALLAGGLATRLRPLTQTIAKSMMEVAGEPFIAHQLRWLERQHIHDIVICTGFLGDTIEAFVGNGERFGVQVRYSPDGANAIGTGGAIKKALPLLGDMFFVMYGDSYLPTAFAPVYDAFRSDKKAEGLMTVFRNEGQWDSCNVVFEEGTIRIYDKRFRGEGMHHIDYGLGILTRKAFADWPADAFDLAEIYQRLLAHGVLAGVEVAERFYEIGSPEGLEETRMFFTKMVPHA